MLQPILASLIQGLSPRVRGNQAEEEGLEHDERSIPACAGEPAGCGACQRWPRVYPRVCGGTAYVIVKGLHLLGLSPRVRGNHAPY